MQNLNDTTIKHLQTLANKYETPAFITEDPSQFLYKFQSQKDTEIISFIAAMLSFGKRDQFIKKINYILEKCESSPYEWIKTKKYKNNFISTKENQDSTFYRFYKNKDLITLFEELNTLISNGKTLGENIKSKYEKSLKNLPKTYLDQIVSESFPKSKIVPKGLTSANKRIHMFLRWMVRNNSPIDKGYWTWYPKSRLIIPLDTHVLQQSKNLGLLPKNATGTKKTAIKLTEILTQIFPEDPVKGDFALFGHGIEKSQKLTI